jgi:enoyl-CoA hydratase
VSVTWHLQDGIYELELGMAPCNEIGTVMLDRLEAFLDDIDPEQAHALIIHSTSAKGFCAGADLKELYSGIVSRPEAEHVPAVRAFLDRIHSVMDRLDMLPLTTIACISRVCFGGGLELALTADIRVAERNARFAFPELRLGIIPGFGGIPRLKRDVGNAMVRDLLMTGRSIRATRAMEVGLVQQVVSNGEALGIARLMAKQVTLFDRDARVTAKQFIKGLPQAELDQEKEHFIRLFQGPAVRRALKKFVEATEAGEVRPYLPS